MPDKSQSIRLAFLTGLFRLLGYLASCDGGIKREEVNRLKLHMKRMNLSEQEQRWALQLFKAGTLPDFNVGSALQELRKSTTPKLMQILLVHLVAMARADGYLMKKELYALQWIGRELGYKSIVFNHLLKMIYEQDQLALSYRAAAASAGINENNTSNTNSTSKSESKANTSNSNHRPGDHNKASQQLLKAYKILGVSAGMTEEEIRRHYKKLASQLHPDKLTGQGLAPDHVHVATERFKRIQAAYSFIKKNRFLYAANPGAAAE